MTRTTELKLKHGEMLDILWALKKASEGCQFKDMQVGLLDLRNKLSEFVSQPHGAIPNEIDSRKWKLSI
jgi:hypothetical protein